MNKLCVFLYILSCFSFVLEVQLIFRFVHGRMCAQKLNYPRQKYRSNSKKSPPFLAKFKYFLFLILIIGGSISEQVSLEIAQGFCFARLLFSNYCLSHKIIEKMKVLKDPDNHL